VPKSQVTKQSGTGAIDMTISSRERLDVNISTTLVELTLTTLNNWSKEGDAVLKKPRGIYAPYRLQNRTGAPLFVWSDIDNTSATKDVDAVKVLHGQAIDWRFDDWKTMREVSNQNIDALY
jgi:vacuolar protein sorting-associated protein 13A/C